MNKPWAARLSGRPLAMAPQALETLLAAGAELNPALPAPDPGPGPRYQLTDHGIAVVPVLGPLVSRGDWLTRLLGAQDYAELSATAETAFADAASRAVVLELDSPGGEVGGLFELVERLTALRQASGKPLWAVASENALSAAYAIASAADRIYVTRTAEVGSIGVVAAHLDESQADAMAGHHWTLIHAGRHKIDGHAHAPLSEDARAAIQADVDALHGQLIELIASNRAMTPESVQATQAAIYRGRRGIDSGLADRLGSLDAALAALRQELDDRRTHRPAPSLTAAPRRQTTMTDDAPLEPLVQDHNEPSKTPSQGPDQGSPAPLVPPPPPSAEAPAQEPNSEEPEESSPQETAQRLRAEFAELAAVAAQGARLGVDLDVADAMGRGVSADALRKSLLESLAARAHAQSLVTTAPQDSAPKESPLLRRARERAAGTLSR